METMKTNNYLNALFSIVFGIVFIAIPEEIALILPLYLLIYLAYRVVFEIVKLIKSKEKKDKIKGFIVAGIDAIIAICIIIFRESVNDVVAILMAINTLTEIAECVYEIIANKGNNKKIAINIILAIIHSILFIALITELGESVVDHIAIYGISFAVRGFKSIADNIKEQMGKGSLKKVIQKSKAFEILAGLMLVIIGASIILPYFETGIENFGDGLWYCFMIVTTIGLGDLAAATTIGRLITIVVGLYGIVVFALITSIFVNLYNENKDKESSKKDANANIKREQLVNNNEENSKHIEMVNNKQKE